MPSAKLACALALATIVLVVPDAASGAVVPKSGYWKGTATPAESYDAPAASYRIDWMVADGKLRRKKTGPVDHRPGRIGVLCKTTGGFSGTEFKLPKPSPLKPSPTGRFSMTWAGNNGLDDYTLAVSGRITSAKRASGTYRFTKTSSFGTCESGEVPWTATWRSRTAPR